MIATAITRRVCLLLAIVGFAARAASAHDPGTPIPADQPAIAAMQVSSMTDASNNLAAEVKALNLPPQAAAAMARAVIQKAFVWGLPNKTLSVCFGPLPEGGYGAGLRQKIADVADQWLAGTAWHFDWKDASGNFHDCASQPAYDSYQIKVDIQYTKFEIFLSLIGNQATGQITQSHIAGQDDFYTMYLLFNSSSLSYNSFFNYYVLHEFGHALGLDHEFQKAACQGVFNLANVARDLGVPADQLATVLPDSNAFYDSTAFDNQSVMLYEFDADDYNDPNDTRCRVTDNNNTLSAGDRTGINTFYGQPPPQQIVNNAALVDEMNHSSVALNHSVQDKFAHFKTDALPFVDYHPDIPRFGETPPSPAGATAEQRVLPPAIRDAVARSLNLVAAPYIVSTISAARDNVALLVNGELSWELVRFGKQPHRVVLHPGTNTIEVRVTGSNRPQSTGWHYAMNFISSIGQPLTSLQGSEETVPTTGPHFNHDFIAARMVVNASEQGIVSIVSKDQDVWRGAK